MINLIEELERIDQKQIVHAQAVRFLYAFALNRRNKEGDHDKALQTVNEIMDSNTTNVSPDVICLAGNRYPCIVVCGMVENVEMCGLGKFSGRVYKDKFIASNYEDREALDKAIEWYGDGWGTKTHHRHVHHSRYRQAFNVSPLEYSGINLTTMLRARGERFEESVELQQIGTPH